MSRTRVAAAVALTALMAAAPVAAAHADEADTVKPVISNSAFGPVKGVYTFTLSQVEENPQKAYVEIQQLEAGKWQKKAGAWFFDTNDFAFKVDTGALAEGVATQLKVSTWDDEGNQAGKTFPVVIDRTKPVATLVTPTSSAPVSNSTVDIRVDATDDAGLNRVVGNIYAGSTLVKSTSSAAAGALAASHTASVVLPDGEYSIRYNASDLAGNIASTGNFPFEIDTIAPVIAFKPGTEKSSGTVYNSIPSFKLSDAGVGEVDYVEVNGKKYDRTNNKWSDLNAGDYAVQQGLNTVVLFDTAGNASVPVTFELDTVKPLIEFKPGAEKPNGEVYTTVPSFKLSDAGNGKVDYVVVNGTKYERTNSKWSDLNAGNYAVQQGENTVELFDTAGNSFELTFKLDTVRPTAVVTQEREAKEGGRIAVTLTFSEPIDAASLGQGWYGSGQTFTKVFYREKDVAVSFADVAGNAGTASFTVIPVLAPAL